VGWAGRCRSAAPAPISKNAPRTALDRRPINETEIKKEIQTRGRVRKPEVQTRGRIRKRTILEMRSPRAFLLWRKGERGQRRARGGYGERGQRGGWILYRCGVTNLRRSSRCSVYLLRGGPRPTNQGLCPWAASLQAAAPSRVMTLVSGPHVQTAREP
jgi:hypothetical protein